MEKECKKKTRPPYGRFIDHAKAGATLQKTERMKIIRTALLFTLAFGFAVATAWVTAVDTDFTAKLVDAAPDGFAQDLTEGILRMRYRASPEDAGLMNPGQIYKFTVDLWATSNVFRKGHLLRLEISSSNFPRFDINPNTGEPLNDNRRWQSAENTVYLDAKHPSRIVLPVIPK